MRRDQESPFCEDLITVESGLVDLQLHVLAKVSSLLEVLLSGGSYEHMHQL